MTNLVAAAAAFTATNVLNVLTPVLVTNTVTVTVTKTNTVTEVVKDPRVTATTNLVTRTFKLHNASSDDLAERFNNMWTGDFGSYWKISKVAQSFPEANALMVTAPQSVMDACVDIVRDVDVEPKQVYIEARFVELSNQAFHRLGIDWAMLNGMKGTLGLNSGYNERKMEGVTKYDSATGQYTIDTTAGSGGRNTANLSYVNATLGMSDLYVVLKALEGSTDARTFSNPKIIVSSGKKATVDMTTKYPNVTVSAKRTMNGSDSSSMDIDMKMAEIPGQDTRMFAKEAYFSWGISLDVTPRVTTNGMINVEIVPTISSLNKDDDIEPSGFVQASDITGDTPSSKYPVINVQRLLTEFNMASEQTAVIGGLSRTIEQQVDTGIPWLLDWWYIGPRLFGGKERVKTQREIIVFVTVGLVDPRDIRRDAGLPLNAVLGKQYTEGIRHEPGERRRQGIQGMDSLDLRSLEEQAHDPRRTNRVARTIIDDMQDLPKGEVPSTYSFPRPFTKKTEPKPEID